MTFKNDPHPPQQRDQVLACATAVNHLLPQMSAARPEIRTSIFRLMRLIDAENRVDSDISAWNDLDDATLSPKIAERISVVLGRIPEGRKEQTILIVEDTEALADLIGECLSGHGRRILKAGTGQEARAIMASETIHLVISDVSLPDADGRDLLVEFRNNPAHSMTPVIIMTSKGQALRTECFALGASAFFEKPFIPDALAAAVFAKLDQVNISNHETRTDSLTGLPNRRAFYEMFDQASAAALRHHRPLAIGILDLDRFKTVNDTYGHESGDTVLKHVAAQVSENIRAEDSIARWGGEEFVMLFRETDAAGAVRALNKARQALESAPVTLSDGSTISVTFSAGASEVVRNMTIQEAIDAADANLYRAKKDGRNRVVGPTVETGSADHALA